MSTLGSTALSGRLSSLQKKLQLMGGFRTGEEKFSLSLNQTSGTSSWNFKSRTIQIGLKHIEGRRMELLAELLMEHEVGHVLYTSRHAAGRKLIYPFDLLNILEDARIEPKRERDFYPLHNNSYNKLYVERQGEVNPFANPFNIGILLRWQRWGVKTMPAKPAELDEDQYAEFTEDWNRFLDLSIEASTTERVGGYAQDLYEKWRYLFDKYKSDEAALGCIEGSADSLLGHDSEPLPGRPKGPKDDSEDEMSSEFFEEPLFEWDLSFIQEQARVLRELLNIKSRTETSYGLSGRRFDARRIENPPLSPFRNKTEVRMVFMLKRVLIVLDGSGSMQGPAFLYACHLAYILSLVFPVDICITTGKSEGAIFVPLSQIDVLRGFKAWGGTENYKSLGSVPQGYSFTLFLTDAVVGNDDLQYARKLSKKTKIGAGYVGDEEQMLASVFPRNFLAQTLDQSIGRMVALFLRRNFIKQIAS